MMQIAEKAAQAIIQAANGTVSTGPANASIVMHTEGALQSLTTWLTSVGIDLGSVLHNLR